jgi:quercetin dioxygenase-like cupin family protein
MPFWPALSLVMMMTLSADQNLGSAVPITSEPHHHLVLSNAYARVFKVEVAPQSATLNHHHAHDYVFIILGDVLIENEVEGKPPANSRMSDGQVLFIKGGFSHVARNLSDRPFRNVTIEVLKPPPSHAEPPTRGLNVGAGAITDTVLDNSSVRATEIRLSKGATLPSRRVLPHLMVAITDLSLASTGPEGKLRLSSGDFSWGDSGEIGPLVNSGDTQATFVEVEFK